MLWATLAQSLWIRSCSSTKRLQECRIRLVWMAWLLWDTLRLLCHNLSFSFNLTKSLPCVMEQRCPSKPTSDSASCAAWWAAAAEAGPLQHVNFARMLSHCTGMTHFQRGIGDGESNPQEQNPQIPIISPSLLQGLWFFIKTWLYQLSGGYDWGMLLKLTQLMDGSWSETDCNCPLSCKGS